MNERMKPEDELSKLIEGCARGDRKCQEQVFRMFFGKMKGVCMRYAKDPDSANDLVQEGFIKVFEKVEGFNRDGSFEGWIRRIMVNTCIDHIRKSKKDPLLTDNEGNFPELDEDEEPEDSLFNVLKPQYVMEAVQQLTPAYKAVFNLYVMEDKSHQEIADLLGISTGTSKSNLAKARMNLKKILEEKYKLLNE